MMLTPTPATDHPQVDRSLDELRVQIATLNTPLSVEATITKAFARSAHRGSSWQTNFGQWFAPGTAVVASLAVGVWMLLGIAPAGLAPNSTPGERMLAMDSNSPFFALKSLEQIALEPNPRVIETQVPKVLLASMGVAIPPETVGESVRAEMLVSAAGQPLALRFTMP